MGRLAQPEGRLGSGLKFQLVAPARPAQTDRAWAGTAQ
jgi:hypothetical protein